MPEPEDIAPEDVERDAVLVTEADSPTGEQIVLQLILARYYTKSRFGQVLVCQASCRSNSAVAQSIAIAGLVGCCGVSTEAYSFANCSERLLSNCAALQITHQDHHSRCRGGKKRVWTLCYCLCRRCR